jgi:hypothetical protein
MRQLRQTRKNKKSGSKPSEITDQAAWLHRMGVRATLISTLLHYSSFNEKDTFIEILSLSENQINGEKITLNLKILFRQMLNRTTFRAARRWLLAVESWIKFRVISCEIHGGLSGTRTGFSFNFFSFAP